MADNNPKTPSPGDIRKIIDDFTRLNKKIDELSASASLGKIDFKKLSSELQDVEYQYAKINEQIKENNLESNEQINRLKTHADKSISLINSAGGSFNKLSGQVDEVDGVLDNFFGGLAKGLSTSSDDFQNVSTSFNKLKGVFNFEDPQEMVSFWREYHRRVRDLGVEFGLSGARLEDFKGSNLEIERAFVSTGQEVGELTHGIKSLYAETGQVNQITPELAKTMGDMARGLGMTTTEVGTVLGQFNNLNVSFNSTKKILEDLRYSAEKSALNTKAVLDTFTKNFETLNTYSFRNGVKGMMEMVKQAQILKIDMNSVLQLSDKLADPEKTMDVAANMQMLGGSFAQLGDFNKLMYDAAVAPEDLAKNIAKATASLGSFDRETGKFSLSFADRLQLKEASSQLGLTEKELMKMSSTAAKVKDLKVSLNVSDLSEDQLNVLGAVAQFDTARGEYTVKMKDEEGKDVIKSVAELSEEDIKRLSDQGEEQTVEQMNIGRMDSGDIHAKNFMLGQYSSLDMFKMIGGDSEEFKKKTAELYDTIFGAGHNMLKKGVFQPIENFSESIVSKKVPEVMDLASLAFKGFIDKVEGFITGMKDTQIGPILNEIVAGFENFKTKIGVGAPPKEGTSTTPPAGQKALGDVLRGPSHMEGGIPFTIGGRSGFEAEGGEVLLTKGVSKNQELLSLASKINELAGGKKLFADGDIVYDSSPKTNVSDDKINITTKVDSAPMARAIMDQNIIFEKYFSEFASQLGINERELGKRINQTQTPNFNQEVFKIQLDSGSIRSDVEKLFSSGLFKEVNSFTENFKESLQKTIDSNIEKIVKVADSLGLKNVQDILKIIPNFNPFKDVEPFIKELKSALVIPNIDDLKNVTKNVSPLTDLSPLKDMASTIDSFKKSMQGFNVDVLKELEKDINKINKPSSLKESTTEKENFSTLLSTLSNQTKSFNDKLNETFVTSLKDNNKGLSKIEQQPISSFNYPKIESEKVIEDVFASYKAFNEKFKELKINESFDIKKSEIPSPKDKDLLSSKYFQSIDERKSFLENKNINQQSSNISSGDVVKNNYSQLFETNQNEIKNSISTLSNYVLGKDLGKVQTLGVGVSPIRKELPDFGFEKTQGQLPSKMKDTFTNEIRANVGGTVSGNIELKIPSFEVTVKGMGGEVTKEMKLPDSARDEIAEAIRSQISKASLYNLSLSMRGGINDGKPSTFEGLNPVTH